MKKLYFKAAVLREFNKPLSIEKIKFPEIKKGQVLIKIHYTGICRSQLMEIAGERNNRKWLPHMLGHEASGEVSKIGEGVKKIKKGDKVILSWIKGKGLENETVNYFNDKGEKINSGHITTFSEYSVVSENRVFRKPTSLNLKEASLYGCAVPTGAGPIIKKIKNIKNKNILIYGLGGIGFFSYLALKKYFHNNNIIIFDKNKTKLNFVENEHKNNFCSNVNDINRNKYDYIFESAGLKKTIEHAFELLKNNGELIFLSHPKNKDKINLDPHDLIKGKNIFGSWGGWMNLDNDMKILTKTTVNSKSLIKKIMNKNYKLKDINKAINDLSNGKNMRPIIKCI